MRGAYAIRWGFTSKMMKECKNYWKGFAGLRDSHFMVTVVKKQSISRKHLLHGTVTIRYNSLALLREIKKEIPAMAEASYGVDSRWPHHYIHKRKSQHWGGLGDLRKNSSSSRRL
jgi:hypothetical protein